MAFRQGELCLLTRHRRDAQQHRKSILSVYSGRCHCCTVVSETMHSSDPDLGDLSRRHCSLVEHGHLPLCPTSLCVNENISLCVDVCLTKPHECYELYNLVHRSSITKTALRRPWNPTPPPHQEHSKNSSPREEVEQVSPGRRIHCPESDSQIQITPALTHSTPSLL
jgi:hypothetical protein